MVPIIINFVCQVAKKSQAQETGSDQPSTLKD